MKILNEGASDGSKSRAYDIDELLQKYDMHVESCRLGDTSERFNVVMPNGDVLAFAACGNRVDGGWLEVMPVKKANKICNM